MRPLTACVCLPDVNTVQVVDLVRRSVVRARLHQSATEPCHVLFYEVLGQLVSIDHPVLLAIPKKLAREGVLRMAVDSKLIWLQHRADHQPALV